jgi:mannose-6-phosphate isomerase-like protein (cupin superfamily)
MLSKFYFVPLAAVLVFAAVAADTPPSSGVVHLDHKKVSAVFATGGGLLATNNFKVLALRRDKPGEVEVHEGDTDIFYVVDGSATFVTGGQLVEPRVVAPGETRARSITGGEERRLEKGDVLMIPNKVPHWFKEVRGQFEYFVVKVAQ